MRILLRLGGFRHVSLDGVEERRQRLDRMFIRRFAAQLQLRLSADRAGASNDLFYLFVIEVQPRLGIPVLELRESR